MKTHLEAVLRKFDHLISKADSLTATHPYLVVVAMHEFHRNIFTSDPYIPYKNSELPHLDRIDVVLEDCIRFLEAGSAFGSYFAGAEDSNQELDALVEDRSSRRAGPVQKVYNLLWQGFNQQHFLKESKTIIEERFAKGSFDLSRLKGMRVLDMGCGSGRFTMGLSQFGPEKVTGVDLGEESIEHARETAQAAGINNVEFVVGDFLDLPFESQTFDFVFCNGVIHHSTDMKKALSELHRVLKPDACAWLYVYGDGGLFWYARKKMPEVMKKIPMAYTLHVLKMIGMPGNRFIFADNWYVPWEIHTTDSDAREMISDVGFTKIERVPSARSMDYDQQVIENAPQARDMFGDGSLRYLLWK